MKTRHNPERKAFKGRSYKKGGELVEDLQRKLDEIMSKAATVLEGVIEREKQYPMCTKLNAVRNDKAIIDCFLEWLEEQDLVICSATGDPHDGGMFEPARKSQDKLLMEYFGIDEKKLEAERQKILKEQRKLNEKTP